MRELLREITDLLFAISCILHYEECSSGMAYIKLYNRIGKYNVCLNLGILHSK